jgi:hypothetical protein
MEIKFSDIELAFEYVSSAPMTSNTAIYAKRPVKFIIPQIMMMEMKYQKKYMIARIA